MKIKEIDPYWTDERVNWYSAYYRNHSFNTEDEARKHVFYRLQRADAEPHASLFGINGPDKNKFISNTVPIYTTGKKFKIGRPVRSDYRLRKSDLIVKRPSLSEINEIAQAQSTSDYDIVPIKWYRIQELIDPTDDYYLKNHRDRIGKLIKEIRKNKWIEAVVVAEGDGMDLWLVEGQHRTRALWLMGFKTVPAIKISYTS
ncbi:MAG: ParB/RepB/Spo0J family partition protein [Candidimonas sp.]